MPILKNVEARIESIERFKVAFTHTKNGVDVKGNKQDIPQYPYTMAAPGSWTVSEWKSNRFKQFYPGYEVRVYTKAGGLASGNMKLSTIREERREP